MSSVLSLAPYQAGGWSFSDTPGYYIHAGRVYLQGEIDNYSAVVSTTILTGLPASLRPAVDTPLTLISDLAVTTDAATPGIVVPQTFAATITAAGVLSLNALPPYINAAPPIGTYYYLDPVGVSHADFPYTLGYGIFLGNTSWAIGGAVADTYTPGSFAALLDSEFSDIDSTVLAHGSRVHLGGHVRAKVDGASLFAKSLPAALTTGLNQFETSVTVASAPTGKFALMIYNGAIQVDSDVGGYPPPASWGGSPTVAIQSETVRGVTSWPDRNGARGAQRLRSPNANAGFASVSWNNGTYTCTAAIALGQMGTVQCPQLGPSSSVMLALGPILDQYFPTAQWFSVKVGISQATIRSGYNQCLAQTSAFVPSCGPGVDPGPLTLTVDAPCDIWGTPTVIGGKTQVIATTSLVFPNQNSPTADRPAYSGYFFDSGLTNNNVLWDLAKPGLAAEYPYDPYNYNSAFLWRPGELSTVTLSLAGQTSSGTLALQASVAPYWEKRRGYLKAGDVLDLTGAGWQSVAPTVGTMLVAGGNSGQRSKDKHRIVGVAHG